MDKDPTLEQYTAAQLRRKIGDVARDLRGLATEVDRIAADVDRVGGPGMERYANLATRLVSRLHNTLPNLALSQVIDHAAQADVARAKGE